MLALVTGAFIGSYTIVDGLGARAAGSPHGYMIWLSLLTALLIVGSALAAARPAHGPERAQPQLPELPRAS